MSLIPHTAYRIPYTPIVDRERRASSQRNRMNRNPSCYPRHLVSVSDLGLNKTAVRTAMAGNPQTGLHTFSPSPTTNHLLGGRRITSHLLLLL